MREANRIVSLKEDMDAASWERVLEISALLQDEIDREQTVELGRELGEIAHSNMSMLSRLGIDPESTTHVMPSGIEVLEGGLAEAALEEQEAAKAHELATEDEPARVPRSEITVPVRTEHLLSKTRSIESLRSEESWDELLGSSADDADLEPFEPGKAEEAEEPEVRLEHPAASDAADEPEEPGAVCEEERVEEQQAEPAPCPAAADTASTREDSDMAHEGGGAQPASPAARRERFARFRTLYESRDHSLCVFEDEHGHLVAVDASKLA